MEPVASLILGLAGAGKSSASVHLHRIMLERGWASVVVTVRVWSAKLATSSKCPPSACT